MEFIDEIIDYQKWRCREEGQHSDDIGLSWLIAQRLHAQSDAPACDSCGAITVRNGNCYLCHNCGQSMGCS